MIDVVTLRYTCVRPNARLERLLLVDWRYSTLRYLKTLLRAATSVIQITRGKRGHMAHLGGV